MDEVKSAKEEMREKAALEVEAWIEAYKENAWADPERNAVSVLSKIARAIRALPIE